eukprot:15430178-Alexandrium_andersonii.AAC.1
MHKSFADSLHVAYSCKKDWSRSAPASRWASLGSLACWSGRLAFRFMAGRAQLASAVGKYIIAC